MTDMTRTLKMIADCDDEVHFERQVKRELLRLHDLIVKTDAMANTQAARIAELEANLKRCTSAASDSGGLTMCADQHCPEYGTCYRAQAKPAPDQRFWAVSPREGNSCRLYAPVYFTNGATVLREDAQ